MSLFAFISDIHGNRAALEAVISDIEKQGASIVACLGDTVGYGPDPAACVDLVQALCFPVLLGNHETYVTLPFEPDEFNPQIKGGIEVAREQLSDEADAMVEGIAGGYRNGRRKPLFTHPLMNRSNLITSFRQRMRSSISNIRKRPSVSLGTPTCPWLSRNHLT